MTKKNKNKKAQEEIKAKTLTAVKGGF